MQKSNSFDIIFLFDFEIFIQIDYKIVLTKLLVDIFWEEHIIIGIFHQIFVAFWGNMNFKSLNFKN